MTLKIYGKVNTIDLDVNRFTKTFRTMMERRNREAIRAFVRETVSRVPVYTGMARASIKYARGSFGPLASWLNVSVQISPVVAKRKAEKFYPDGKSIEAGATRGDYKVQMGPNTFSFTFNTEVPHFFWNEYGFNSRFEAWKAYAAGYEAYQNEFRQGVIKNFPGLTSFVKVTAVFNQAP